jgi:hypothetical protein
MKSQDFKFQGPKDDGVEIHHLLISKNNTVENSPDRGGAQERVKSS